MRHTALLIAAMIVGLASEAPAAAGPENRDAFARRVAKYVLDATGTTVNVACKIPMFDYMTGASLDDYITCAVEWDMLAT